MKFPSPRDSELIREYVLLPLLLLVLARDQKIIAQSSIKLKQPYLDTLQSAMDRVMKDMGRIRQTLRSRGFRFYEETRDDLGIYVKYVYQGYHHTLRLHWEYLKGQVEMKLKEYLSHSYN